MKEKFKIVFENVLKFIDSWVFILCLLIMSFVMGVIAQHRYYVLRTNKTKEKYVREFIEYPSCYKLDTLYRKSQDTLYIDTIKIKYLK